MRCPDWIWLSLTSQTIDSTGSGAILSMARPTSLAEVGRACEIVSCGHTQMGCGHARLLARLNTSGRGVRHGASWRMRFQNPMDFTWISDFRMDFWISKWISGFQKVDFWISKWISGFQSGFLDFKADFWISKRISGFQSGLWIPFEPLLFRRYS